MIDPKLEEQIASTQQLLQYWQRFHDYFSFGVKGTDIDQQREMEFLQIKSQIAMLHDSFMEALSHDRNIGQNIMGICSRSITLKNLKKLSNADVQKMEIEWHESYLLLNETLGTLQEKRQKIAEINPYVFKIKRGIHNFQIQVGNFFKLTWVRALLVLLVIVGLVVGVFAFDVISLDTLEGNRYTQPLYKTLIKVAKVVNSNVPYDSFDEVKRDLKWPGNDVKIDKSDMTKDNVLGFLANLGINDADGEIRNAIDLQRAIYSADETQPGSSGVPPARIIMIRFPEVRHAGEFVYRVKSRYDDHLNLSNEPRYMQVFNVRNIAVIVSASDSDISRQIRQKEFGQ